MDRASAEKQKAAWELTQAAFARLLSWLDEGTDSGGARYLEMRRRLHAWFDRKACPNPEALADETLNRVARRLTEAGAITGATPAQFCYITAKYVWLESLRQPPTAALEEVELQQRPALHAALRSEATEPEARFTCLEACMNRLSQAERTLLLRYFTGEERTKIAQRQQLATELKISANALSLRLFRLRAKLEQCVRDCLAKGA